MRRIFIKIPLFILPSRFCRNLYIKFFNRCSFNSKKRNFYIAKGFTLFETLVCLAIIGILLTVAIPVTYRFIVNAEIKEADINASIIRTVISEYLMGQNAMAYNNKYAYIAIGVGENPDISKDSIIISEYTLISSKNKEMPDSDIDVEISINTWGNNSAIQKHRVNITRLLDDALGGLRNCYIIALVKNNIAEQVYYVPDIYELGFIADYDKVCMFFDEHCEIKGKYIDTISFDETATVFIKKDGAVTNGRSTAGIYEGMIIGTSPLIR